jgi:serine/threonine protein kinase
VSNPAGTTVPREARDFGNYELVAKLATGGMAEIFLARRTDPVGRGDLVVIKRILPHLADDEHFVTMFRDEAALASKLEHPNVCRVFSLGHTDNTWFIVMEYLHGVALSRMLTRVSKNKGRLDLRIVAAIVIQACEGLHHAHELRAADGHLLGVVHRDVSPPNIFIGADGIVKLLDFGIAKARGASSKTRTGTVKGKNAYMSPEQILGKPLDRRSDVFALGAVLYELLAVKRLFHRDSDFLTFKAITEEPIPDIKERRPDLPAALREVVGRALARDVNARYATAKDLAEAVRAAVPGGPATPMELAAMIAGDFGDELDAKQQLADQQPSTAGIGANSNAVPTLAVSSGSHMAVAPTVVERPQARGNQLAARGGELTSPPPFTRRPATRPPPLPGMVPTVETAPQTPAPSSPASPPTTVPLPGLVVAPFAPVTAENRLDTAAAMATDLSTDLLGERRRGLIIKGGLAVVLVAGLAGVFMMSRDGESKPAAVPPDAAVEEAAPVPVPQAADAGVNKDDIIAISRFGYFSIAADEETILFIDNNRIGKITPEKPLKRLPLEPGPHKVKAQGPKKKTKTFDITVFGGQDTDWGTIDW